MIFDTIFLCVVFGLLGYITYRALRNVEGEVGEESKGMKHDCTINNCSYMTDACKNRR